LHQQSQQWDSYITSFNSEIVTSTVSTVRQFHQQSQQSTLLHQQSQQWDRYINSLNSEIVTSTVSTVRQLHQQSQQSTLLHQQSQQWDSYINSLNSQHSYIKTFNIETVTSTVSTLRQLHQQSHCWCYTRYVSVSFLEATKRPPSWRVVEAANSRWLLYRWMMGSCGWQGPKSAIGFITVDYSLCVYTFYVIIYNSRL